MKIEMVKRKERSRLWQSLYRSKILRGVCFLGALILLGQVLPGRESIVGIYEPLVAKIPLTFPSQFSTLTENVNTAVSSGFNVLEPFRSLIRWDRLANAYRSGNKKSGEVPAPAAEPRRSLFGVENEGFAARRGDFWQWLLREAVLPISHRIHSPGQPILLDDEKRLSLFEELGKVVERVSGRAMPSWLGLWTIQRPRGVMKGLAKFPTAEEIEWEAYNVYPLINELKDKKFFRIMKVDLGRKCPFWARQDLCMSPNGACNVCECASDEVPSVWRERPTEYFVDRNFFEEEQITPWREPYRAATLADSASGLEGETSHNGWPFDPTAFGSPTLGAATNFESVFLSELSGASPGTTTGSASGSSEGGSYVDLSLNPPGFTSYKGRNIWELIYKENCIPAPSAPSGSTDLVTETCTEETMFRKIISGLQTVIMVLAAEYNKPFNYAIPLPFTAPNELLPNRGMYVAPRHLFHLDLFRYRVGSNREWMENLYLDFSILLNTLARVEPIFRSCECYTGTEVEDATSRHALNRLLDDLVYYPSASAERKDMPIFERHQQIALQQFTNISRIFDCVECEKCRLHGKVKLSALQVALKAATPPRTPTALSRRPQVTSLERNQVSALINTIGYYADAILIIQKFHTRLHALRTLAFAGLVVGAAAAVKITALLLRSLPLILAALRAALSARPTFPAVRLQASKGLKNVITALRFSRLSQGSTQAFRAINLTAASAAASAGEAASPLEKVSAKDAFKSSPEIHTLSTTEDDSALGASFGALDASEPDTKIGDTRKSKEMSATSASRRKRSKNRK